MGRIRINKDNPSGRTTDVLEINGEKVTVDTENWVEVSDTDIGLLCLNPILYEIKKDADDIATAEPELGDEIAEKKAKKKK